MNSNTASRKKIMWTVLIIGTILLGIMLNYACFHEEAIPGVEGHYESRVFITPTGECYHSPGCSYITEKYAIGIKQAKAAGYRACQHCHGYSSGTIYVEGSEGQPEKNNIIGSIIIIAITLTFWIYIAWNAKIDELEVEEAKAAKAASDNKQKKIENKIPNNITHSPPNIENEKTYISNNNTEQLQVNEIIEDNDNVRGFPKNNIVKEWKSRKKDGTVTKKAKGVFYDSDNNIIFKGIAKEEKINNNYGYYFPISCSTGIYYGNGIESFFYKGKEVEDGDLGTMKAFEMYNEYADKDDLIKIFKLNSNEKEIGENSIFDTYDIENKTFKKYIVIDSVETSDFHNRIGLLYNYPKYNTFSGKTIGDCVSDEIIVRIDDKPKDE